MHQIALVVNGIFLLENMKLDQLAAGKVYEFAFAVQPLKIKGGDASRTAANPTGRVRAMLTPIPEAPAANAPAPVPTDPAKLRPSGKITEPRK